MRYSACTARSTTFGRYWKPPATKSFSISSATRPAPKKPTGQAAFYTRPCRRTATWCWISIRLTTLLARSRPTPPARSRRLRTAWSCALRPAKRSTGIRVGQASRPVHLRHQNRSGGLSHLPPCRRDRPGGLSYLLRQVSLQIAKRIADLAQAAIPIVRLGDLDQHLFVNADEQGRDLGVAPSAAGLLLQYFQRVGAGIGLLIGPRMGQRVVDIHHLQDARQ